jgi:tetratricopeptide (TPR) repeat protein
MSRQDRNPHVETNRRTPTVVVLLVAIACGAAGFLCGRGNWFASTPPTASDQPNPFQQAAATQQPPSEDQPQHETLRPFDSRLVDPAAPRPDEPDDLVAELLGMVDFLQEEFPDNPDALEVKARSLEFLGRSDEALAIWQKCLELNPQYSHAYFGMGNVAAKKEELEEAVALFQRAIELDPSFFLARAALADVYLRMNRPEEAIETLEAFLARDPRSQGYYLLARAWDQLQQPEKARENYQSAIRLYPQYAEAHHGLARVQIRLGEREAARQTMEIFRELRTTQQDQQSAMRTPEHDYAAMCEHAAEMFDFAARLFAFQGDTRTAERLWSRGVVLGPRNVECRQALAAITLREGRVRRTIELMEELAAIKPQNQEYWIEAGRLFMTLFDYEAAEAAFQRARDAAPDRADGYAALAKLLLESRSDLPLARQYATEAVKRESSVAAHMLLAEACEANQDRAGALAAVTDALALQPDDPDLQRIYQSLQQKAPPPPADP